MGEPYRTLLGHFRHEIAHYYWTRLVAKSPSLGEFRELFGDERRDYGAALQEYYTNGAFRPMRVLTLGRISRRPGRIISTWSIHSRPRMPSALSSSRSRPEASLPSSTSIPMKTI
jgi:hypothetical protein